MLLLHLLILLSTFHVALAGPLRVFVLAGQSNMVGPASIEHLHQLLTNATTSADYRHLWSGSNWTQREDVFVRFEDQVGNLTVGYGYPGEFGPELEFGWTVGDALDGEKILLIKTAWGGKSLAVDFRPPSSGIGNYSYCDANTQKCYLYPPIFYGNLYRLMVAEVFETLSNLERYVPGYKKDDGYNLSGLVWLQGCNDLLGWDMVGEYKTNLINLISDIRLDLNAPNLPVVIGELGPGGLDPPSNDKEKILAIRQIQQEVASLEEFKDTSRFVKTSIYVDNNAERFNQFYHYWGRADTFCKMGRAFGNAMLEMITKNQGRRKKQYHLHSSSKSMVTKEFS